jgi:hypothetical protein
MSVQVGISTACLFPMTTEQALDRVLRLGCPVAEVFVNSPSEATIAFARTLRQTADAAVQRLCRFIRVLRIRGGQFFREVPASL